jgi:hypothetical protein
MYAQMTHTQQQTFNNLTPTPPVTLIEQAADANFPFLTRGEHPDAPEGAARCFAEVIGCRATPKPLNDLVAPASAIVA